MSTSIIKKAAVIFTVILIMTGCAAKEDMALSQPFAPPAANKIPEAYINLPDKETSSEEAKKSYPTMSNSAPESSAAPGTSQTDSSASGNTQNSAQVKLEEIELAGKTLYRLNGGDYFIRRPLEEDANVKTAVSNCAKWFSGLQSANPNVKFYTYYVTRATNCDWYGKENGIYTYDYASFFEKQLGSDTQIKNSRYKIANLQDYMNTGYKTDFHVNNVGSYRIYQDIYQMLSADTTLSPMIPQGEESNFNELHMIGDLFDNAMLKGLSFTDGQMDIFKAYQFNYGDYTSYINDKKMILGLEKEYADGQIDRDPRAGHQFAYYGGQTGVIRLEFNHPDKPNLLLLSDSQGRPSRKLIASHFNRTIFLDDVQTRSNDIEKVIKENNIGVVILIGQESMFEIYNG